MYAHIFCATLGFRNFHSRVVRSVITVASIKRCCCQFSCMHPKRQRHELYRISSQEVPAKVPRNHTAQFYRKFEVTSLTRSCVRPDYERSERNSWGCQLTACASAWVTRTRISLSSFNRLFFYWYLYFIKHHATNVHENDAMKTDRMRCMRYLCWSVDYRATDRCTGRRVLDQGAGRLQQMLPGVLSLSHGWWQQEKLGRCRSGATTHAVVATQAVLWLRRFVRFAGLIDQAVNSNNRSRVLRNCRSVQQTRITLVDTSCRPTL